MRIDTSTIDGPASIPAEPHSHYFHDVAHLQSVDIYRMLQLLGITAPALQHAFKKVAAAGKRGTKSAAQDVQEAIDSLQRWQQMQAEDAAKEPEQPPHVIKPGIYLDTENNKIRLVSVQEAQALSGKVAAPSADHRAAWLRYMDKGPGSSTAQPKELRPSAVGFGINEHGYLETRYAEPSTAELLQAAFEGKP